MGRVGTGHDGVQECIRGMCMRPSEVGVSRSVTARVSGNRKARTDVCATVLYYSSDYSN